MSTRRSTSTKRSRRTSNDSLVKEKAKQEHGRVDPSKPPTSSSNHPRLQQFISETVSATNPSIRHIASASSISSIKSHGSNVPVPPLRAGFPPLSTTFAEQRYSGPKDVKIANTMRDWDPINQNPDRTASMKSGNHTTASSTGHRSRLYGMGSEVVTFVSNRDSSLLEADAAARDKEKDAGANQPVWNQTTIDSMAMKADEIVYPGPLGLFILITGIALSVFLISLDRTIITTAIPFISNEFNSSSDIGWYGSSYLLTASAFQPLYGRVFTLFNIKWSYLAALSVFELGSLICGIAPNSFTLIIGRAIAGLGSAGILTGSFVVVAHAVPLQQRPILTAVVGLMFGVGATVGPLLGGVFTDLVTWRWCFYFNLPVGGATFAAMLWFFSPPRKHAMMGKSFVYRIMELDLVGNAILLGACIMLFLALQFTEQNLPWGSAKVVGNLVGAGCAFVVFSTWMWWKADGALMPPRILGQRTVAASCAAAFFIYSTILVQTYYLPMWFQAIRGTSAVHSGVNMIPYVAANAIFSLLAGIFVSKNGLFIVPAVVGMVIGTIGSGLISTFYPEMSTGMWIGYEILASAGIGMAIQQGFTAVQIVLPMDEVAIGTAAVVAFQSLGGAIFVSVGNNILQNSLQQASDSNLLPGVDIKEVIDAGASEFRNLVSQEQLPELLKVYNRALQKVFTASIPVAGLAAVACLFMERRTVRPGEKDVLELEGRRRPSRGREDRERAIVEAHRFEEARLLESGRWWRRRFGHQNS